MFNREGIFAKKPGDLRKDLRPPLAAPLPQPHPLARAAAKPAPVEAPRPEPVPAPARAGEARGSKLIVGQDIKLKGAEITDCDTLIVEGRVEAAMDSRVMQISEHGVFCGTAGIDLAEIHGRFEGDLTVRGQLVIHATGKVTGKIRYARLTIQEGGELSGDIGALAAGDAQRRERAFPTQAKAGQA